jgi:TusA-related sulfurtransferase
MLVTLQLRKRAIIRMEALRLQREQQFMRDEPGYAMTLELEEVRCPLHIHRFKPSLNQLLPGQILKLQSKSKVLVKDLEAACRIMGIETKMLRYRRQYFLYAVQTSVQQAVVYPIRQKLSNLETVASASNQRRVPRQERQWARAAGKSV